MSDLAGRYIHRAQCARRLVLASWHGLGTPAAIRTPLVAYGSGVWPAWFPVSLFLTLHLSLQGYRVLTREDLAATIQTEPTGPSQFRVTVQVPGRQPERFQLAGDEVYIDAHILKWKPWANLFGLHTAYTLDRIAGRYHAIEDEDGKPHTVYTLGGTRAVDLFLLRRRFAWLKPVVDAEYGSAAFFPTRDRVSLEL
ncbi:MAG: hypothetical protein HC801_09110, partial [Nitrospira sp.]|nr:hypothetical protein [Nitrospira sp.]